MRQSFPKTAETYAAPEMSGRAIAKEDAPRAPAVSIQVERLASLAKELHEEISVLETRLQMALLPCDKENGAATCRPPRTLSAPLAERIDEQNDTLAAALARLHVLRERVDL